MLFWISVKRVHSQYTSFRNLRKAHDEHYTTQLLTAMSFTVGDKKIHLHSCYWDVCGLQNVSFICIKEVSEWKSERSRMKWEHDVVLCRVCKRCTRQQLYICELTMFIKCLFNDWILDCYRDKGDGLWSNIGGGGMVWMTPSGRTSCVNFRGSIQVYKQLFPSFDAYRLWIDTMNIAIWLCSCDYCCWSLQRCHYHSPHMACRLVEQATLLPLFKASPTG